MNVSTQTCLLLLTNSGPPAVGPPLQEEGQPVTKHPAVPGAFEMRADVLQKMTLKGEGLHPGSHRAAGLPPLTPQHSRKVGIN